MWTTLKLSLRIVASACGIALGIFFFAAFLLIVQIVEFAQDATVRKKRATTEKAGE
jgi:hypothetical protein